MTATTLTPIWTRAGAQSRPRTRAASERVAIGFLSVSLLISYLQYCFERSDLIRLVPVVLLMAGSFLCLLICPREKRNAILRAVVRPALLASIALVTVPPLLSSLLYRPTLYPFEYGIVTAATLFVVRILLSAIGFEGVLLSFFYATSAGMLIVAGLNFSDLLASTGAMRFAPFFYDPNRIAFFAATSIPVQLWYVSQRRRHYVLLLTALSLFVMIGASSRGSIGALLIGGLVATIIHAVKLPRSASLTISRNKLIGILALLCVFAVVAGVEERRVADAGQFLTTKLALDDRARGLNTGFTGRTMYWAQVTQILPKTLWLVGNGFRTSDEDFNFSLDNGYLASVYEIGLFSTVIVLAKYIFFVYFLAAVYLSNRWAKGTLLLTLFFTLVVFFSNAYVHRVFFGIGEQVSILVLFAFVSTRNDVLNMLQPSLIPLSSPVIR
jgi:hypothetical protein